MKDEDKTRQELLDEVLVLREALARAVRDRRSAGYNGTPGVSINEAANRAYIEALPDMLFLFDRDGRFIDYQTNRLDDLLLPPDHFIGKLSRDVLPPDLAALSEQIIREVFETGQPRTYSYSMMIRGEQRHYDARMVLSAEEQVLAVVRDITELKRAQEALARSEEKFRDLFENANDAIFLVDEHQVYIDANKKALELTGYSRQELIGKSIFEFIPEDQKQRSRDEFVKLEQTGKYERFLGKTRTKQGQWIDIEVSSSAIVEGGRYAGSRDIVRNVTDQVRAAAALKESEARLKEAQRISHVGNWEWDVATGAVFWSDELFRIYGYEPRSIAPDYSLVLEALHPDSRKQFEEAISAALRGEKAFDMDYAFFRADGSEAVLHTIGTVIPGLDGKPSRMVGIVQDITAQKKAEAELRVTNNRLTTLIETMPDMVIFKDARGRHLIVNKAAEAATGHSKAEFLGKTVEDLIPPEPAAICRATDEQTMNLGIPVQSEEQIPGPDGNTTHIEMLRTPMIDEHNAVIGLVAVGRDITARKQAEAALKSSEHFIRNILDTVDEGFIVIDRDFRIITANKAYCDQTSQEGSDQIIGRHCFEVSHHAGRPCYETGETCSVQNVFRTGEPQKAVHRHTDGRGGLLYVETKAFPIKNEKGEVVSAIETVNNITERHLLEEERLKSQKLEAIGTLAGGIAHDFNNLLQGIFGYISMAKMTIDRKERSLAMLEQAEQALQMSVNLTKQLLTFSKGGRPVKKIIPLAPVIEGSIKFALSGSSVDYRLAIAEDLRPIEADEGQIGQVIQNIVLNADQAMPLGGTIVITARNVQAPKKTVPAEAGATHYVEIAVQDTGIGIAEPYLQRIFDPYFTTKEKGSGLGLATAYSIIRNHGGAIDVESEPGAGTVFYLYLPAAHAEAPSSRPVASPTPSDRTGRVLVMDDEELIRSILCEQIKAYGHEVDSAENGDRAIEKFVAARTAGTPYDIVILDLTVRGGKGGKETIKELLEIDADVKAVVSSGYSEDAVIADHRKHGFAACLTKPYDMTDLRNTLNALLIEEPRRNLEATPPAPMSEPALP